MLSHVSHVPLHGSLVALAAPFLRAGMPETALAVCSGAMCSSFPWLTKLKASQGQQTAMQSADKKTAQQPYRVINTACNMWSCLPETSAVKLPYVMQLSIGRERQYPNTKPAFNILLNYQLWPAALCGRDYGSFGLIWFCMNYYFSPLYHIFFQYSTRGKITWVSSALVSERLVIYNGRILNAHCCTPDTHFNVVNNQKWI